MYFYSDSVNSNPLSKSIFHLLDPENSNSNIQCYANVKGVKVVAKGNSSNRSLMFKLIGITYKIENENTSI